MADHIQTPILTVQPLVEVTLQWMVTMYLPELKVIYFKSQNTRKIRISNILKITKLFALLFLVIAGKLR